MAPDAPLETSPDLAEIERAIEENRERERQLLRQRELLILQDPEQRSQRERALYHLVGRWRAADGLTFSDVAALKVFDESLEWLLGTEVLEVSGWSHRDDCWFPPPRPQSAE